MVDSGDDPDIGAILDEFGFKGYYVFFRTLEIMSREFNIESPGELHATFNWFLSRYRRGITKKFLLNFFEFSSKLGRFQYKINSKHIWIKNEKLKDLVDNYTTQILKDTSNKTKSNFKDSTKPRARSFKKKKKEEEDSKNIYKKLRHQIIKYLNEKTGKTFNPDSSETIKFISGRISDKDNPATLEVFEHVIDVKCAQWLGTEQEGYLRPTTLFRPTNFESYRNERYIPPKKKGHQISQVGGETTREKTERLFQEQVERGEVKI